MSRKRLCISTNVVFTNVIFFHWVLLTFVSSTSFAQDGRGGQFEANRGNNGPRGNNVPRQRPIRVVRAKLGNAIRDPLLQRSRPAKSVAPTLGSKDESNRSTRIQPLPKTSIETPNSIQQLPPSSPNDLPLVPKKAPNRDLNNSSQSGDPSLFHDLPTFREDYGDYLRNNRPAENRRFSSDVGANLSGVYTTPTSTMPATEMVIKQAARIEMLEKQLAASRTEAGILKQELALTVDTLNQTNVAFGELQTQLISANQQNQSLRIKFQELATTYSQSESEIQEMLTQLRVYISRELNAPTSIGPSSMSPRRSKNKTGVVPTSELLPPPKK